MVGKIGIRIPSHNSLTPAFFDELLIKASTSRKVINAKKIRSRLPEKYSIAVVSTGLSYLAYLGVLKKVPKGYKTSRLGKRIGKLLVKDSPEAKTLWAEILKRHRIYRLFRRYFSLKANETSTIEDFGAYLKKRAHANWNIKSARSRISRLCELFADKGLIEYQNGTLFPVIEARDTALMELENKHLTLESSTKELQVNLPQQLSTSVNSWPIKIEIKIEIAKNVDSQTLQMISSFIKDLRFDKNEKQRSDCRRMR